MLVSLIAVEIAIFNYPLAWFLSLDIMSVILYGIGPINLGLTVSAFDYDIQKQSNSQQGSAN